MRTFSREEIWRKVFNLVVGGHKWRIPTREDLLERQQLAMVEFRRSQEGEPHATTVSCLDGCNVWVAPSEFMDLVVLDQNPIRPSKLASREETVYYKHSASVMQCFVGVDDMVGDVGEFEMSGPYAFHLFLAPR